MASRRTRLKGSKTPGSSETRHAGRRAARLSVSKRKSTSTPSGPKAVKRLKTNTALKLNKSSATPNLKKEASSKQTKSKTTKITPSFQDAYEFNESDEFINGLGNSFLFTPASKSSRQKVPKKVTQKVPKTAHVTLTKVRFQSDTLKPRKKPNISQVAQKSKKDELTSLSKSVKAVREKREMKKVSDQSEKKTSTPLLSESVNNTSTEKQGSSLSRVRRSPRIIIPRLNLDLSVTPILPVANGTPVSQSSRVGTKKLEGNEPNVDSFMDAQKSPQETPSCPGEKVERRASLRRAAVTVQTSESLTPTGTACFSKIRVGSKVSGVVEKKDLNLKRKQSEPKSLVVKSASSANSKVVTSTSVKRQKPAQSQSTEKQQNLASAKVSNSAAKSSNSKQQTYLKLNSEKTAASLNSNRQRKPAPKSMPQQEDAADNDVDSSPSLPDSGISFGSDSASSRATDASGTPSLPGFMEDEPLQSELQDLSSSPFTSPNFDSTSAKDPESILNKSTSKEYNLKTGKAKREKGRYSTSKLDAWASATNQSLEELESFELVVE